MEYSIYIYKATSISLVIGPRPRGEGLEIETRPKVRTIGGSRSFLATCSLHRLVNSDCNKCCQTSWDRILLGKFVSGQLIRSNRTSPYSLNYGNTHTSIQQELMVSQLFHFVMGSDPDPPRFTLQTQTSHKGSYIVQMRGKSKNRG